MLYVHGSVVTPYGIASNNRGESTGNESHLQKIHWKGLEHTTVSAEAKRYALRRRIEDLGLPVNRRHEPGPDGVDVPFAWADPGFSSPDSRKFADDDVFGYMYAKPKKPRKGKTDVEPAEPEDDAKGGDSTVTRTSRLSISRSISLDPWDGDTLFNSASRGASPHAMTDKAKKGGVATPVPYGSEVHATRYQFFFTLEPSSLLNREYARVVIEQVCKLGKVAGNHARFYYDFSAESVFLRLTDQPDHRMSYCFHHAPDYSVDASEMVQVVLAGDVDPGGLYVGGSIARGSVGSRLKDLGATVDASVASCVNALVETMLSRI